jgi:hypothetical protein
MNARPLWVPQPDSVRISQVHDGRGAPRAPAGAERGLRGPRGERRRRGVRGAQPLGSKWMDLSSLLQGATHVFPAAAQDCVRTPWEHEFRVYVDRIVDLSQPAGPEVRAGAKG